MCARARVCARARACVLTSLVFSAGGRLTRSKQRELDGLREEHEDLVATMQETAARREAASKQVTSLTLPLCLFVSLSLCLPVSSPSA